MHKKYLYKSLFIIAFVTNGLFSFAQLVPCQNGFSDIYPCMDIGLYAFMPSAEIGGGIINDNWGWTSPVTGNEYAIQGRSSGTSFIDISDPENPIYLGNLPTHSFESLWRDLKVYNNHAFIVSEADNHGLQIIDLLQLDNVTEPPIIFEESAHYPAFGKAHNVAINEESGYAYAVGTNTFAGGLHFVNIQDPTNPTAVGGFDADGYTHDVQVVVYHGDDLSYVGKEIAFASNEDSFTIVDVADKSDPMLISRTEYSNSAYTHQGWLTEDHNYFLHNDELDELNFGNNTRTFVWDIHNLEEPELLGFYESTSTAIDHNLYVLGNHVYLANYRSGLRVLRLNNIAEMDIEEVAYFDIAPSDDDTQFSGSWNVYPYFESGSIILSSMYAGFYVLQPNFDFLTSNINDGMNEGFSMFPNPAQNQITLRMLEPSNQAIEIYSATGQKVLTISSNSQNEITLDVSSLTKGMYLVRNEKYSSKLIIN